MSVLVACVALPASTAHAALPNLVSDPAQSPQLGVSVFSTAPQERLLLRFDSYVHNEGPGVLHIRGSSPLSGSMQDVFQVVDGTPVALPGADVVYEASSPTNADSHNHWHFQNAARYALVTTGGAPAAPDAPKVGFCLLDSEAVPGGPSPAPDDCGTSSSTQVDMGVSPGWRDQYRRSLMFQWVDVSEVQPGDYLLRSEVDPDDLIDETDEINPGADLPVRVPGYRPKARSVAAGPVTLALDADRVEPITGTMGAPSFKVVDPPDHGTLDVATNTWTTDQFVQYAPDDPSAPQPDTFDYVARAGDSDFPRDAFLQPATATIGSGSQVAISGAPQSMIGGTSIQLSANAPVAWSASRGTIAASGRFTAPLTAGPVAVTAVDAGGTADTKTIAVSAPPVPEPAPLPVGAPPGDSAVVPPAALAPVTPARLPRRSIEAAVAQQVGRFVSVTTKPGRSGTLRVLLRRNGRRVDSCRTRATAGRSYTCRLRRPRKGAGKLRVVVELKRLDGKVVRQAVRISTARVR